MKNDVIFTREEPMIGRLSAIVTTPTGFDPAKEKLPVIVFLHGAGENGSGGELAVQRVRAHGIPKYFGADADYLGLRVITVSPQCPEELIWDNITLQLKDFLDAAVETFGGDKERISITGLSMGGFGTWNMLLTYPGYFRRAAPICGGGVSWRFNERHKKTEIRIYHSVDDDSVPYEYSVLMARQVRGAGVAVEFTTYCAEGHGCWDRAYETTDLIEWLASGGETE